MRADVLIVGAGPAGSTAAALLAQCGKRVVVLEKSKFPRDKVCGDCVNPSAWSVLDRLGLRGRILAMQPTQVRKVEFHGAHGESVNVALAASEDPEIVIRRRDLDALLIARAVELGAEFIDEVAVTAMESGWTLVTPKGRFSAPVVLAADGRNSTLARLCGRLPAASRERVALQTHTRTMQVGASVRMFFHRHGYGGIAALSETETNLCLVSGAREIDALREYAESAFGLGTDTKWNAITPLSRDDARPLAADGLFLLGDAARVVEPFTGEGIYYAMHSGELAADAILQQSDPVLAERQYAIGHQQMYRGRQWVNALSRIAALNPVLTSRMLPLCRTFPWILGALTRKVAEASGSIRHERFQQ